MGFGGSEIKISSPILDVNYGKQVRRTLHLKFATMKALSFLRIILYNKVVLFQFEFDSQIQREIKLSMQ